MSHEGRNILVYSDEGTSSVDVLIKSLESALKSWELEGNTPTFKVCPVLAEDVLNGSCFQDACLFVMPGGRDLPYVAKLEEQGVANIKDFVKRGGNYLGLCAGAYFASAFCEFEKGTEMEICGARDLNFFPGKACGCVFPGFKYGTEEGSKIVSVMIQKTDFVKGEQLSFPCYYNGGCEFLFANSLSYDGVDVVAKYKEFPEKIAIVLCKIGQGNALLSGVHPEMDYKYINRSKFTKEKLKLMEDISEAQRNLFHAILKLILK